MKKIDAMVPDNDRIFSYTSKEMEIKHKKERIAESKAM